MLYQVHIEAWDEAGHYDWYVEADAVGDATEIARLTTNQIIEQRNEKYEPEDRAPLDKTRCTSVQEVATRVLRTNVIAASVK